MRKKLTALALTATLAAGGGAALVGPGLAFAQDSTSAAATADATADRAAARTAAIRTALAGLVTDGTLTQAQADRVATTLSTADLGHGRRGMKAGRVSSEATAEVLGITVEELRTAREAGQTLAQIAEAEGVSRDDLISGLVAAAQAQLTEAVEAGTITQARADELAAGLQERVTEKVDDVHTGRGDRSRDTDDDDAADTTETPAPTASATA